MRRILAICIICWSTPRITSAVPPTANATANADGVYVVASYEESWFRQKDLYVYCDVYLNATLVTTSTETQLKAPLTITLRKDGLSAPLLAAHWPANTSADSDPAMELHRHLYWCALLVLFDDNCLLALNERAHKQLKFYKYSFDRLVHAGEYSCTALYGTVVATHSTQVPCTTDFYYFLTFNCLLSTVYCLLSTLYCLLSL